MDAEPVARWDVVDPVSGPTSPTLGAIRDCGIVAVVTVDDIGSAAPLGEALLAAGLTVVEVTARTDAAFDVIERLVGELPELVVGAGTILDGDAARRATDAGSRFLVSPGLAPEVIEWAGHSGTTAIPGVLTASEIMYARRLGCTIVKLFPAGGTAGLDLLGSYESVFPDVGFVPTGGIDAGTIRAYLMRPNVVACGGSWMAPRRLVAAGDFGAIRELATLAREEVERVRGA